MKTKEDILGYFDFLINKYHDIDFEIKEEKEDYLVILLKTNYLYNTLFRDIADIKNPLDVYATEIDRYKLGFILDFSL